MATRSTIVVLEDNREWSELLARLIQGAPETESLRVVRLYSYDEDAGLVESNHAQILGYTMDIMLGPGWGFGPAIGPTALGFVRLA